MEKGPGTDQTLKSIGEEVRQSYVIKNQIDNPSVPKNSVKQALRKGL